MKTGFFLILVPAAAVFAQIPAPQARSLPWKPDQPLTVPLSREAHIQGVWLAGRSLWRPETNPGTPEIPATPATPVTPVTPATPSVSRQLELPAGFFAQPGLTVWRLESPQGVSDPHLIYMEDLPQVSGARDNFSPGQAQLLEVPAALDSFCPPQKSRFYRIEPQAGDRLSFEIVADRLGSRLDAFLRLLDGAGRELAANDDGDGAVGRDSRLSHRFDQSAPCWIEVRDLNHEGGDGHFFHLRVGRFPIVHTPPALSLNAPADSTPAPSLFGWSRMPVGDATSGRADAPVLLRPWKTFEETGSGASADRVLEEFPASFSGSLRSPGEQDTLTLKAAPGRRLQITSRTRSIGSPAHLKLELLDATGKKLAGSPAPGPIEPEAAFAMPEAGLCHLQIRNLLRGGSEDHRYHLEITDDPGFSLQVDRDTWNGAAGETVEFTLTCRRTHHQGPISLQIVPDHPALRLAENILPARDPKKGRDDKTGLEMKLRIEISRDATPGTILHFYLTGSPAAPQTPTPETPETSATPASDAVRPSPPQVPAGTQPALAKRWPAMKALPGELDGWISFGVNAPAAPPKKEPAPESEKPAQP